MKPTPPVTNTFLAAALPLADTILKPRLRAMCRCTLTAALQQGLNQSISRPLGSKSILPSPSLLTAKPAGAYEAETVYN